MKLECQSKFNLPEGSGFWEVMDGIYAILDLDARIVVQDDLAGEGFLADIFQTETVELYGRKFQRLWPGESEASFYWSEPGDPAWAPEYNPLGLKSWWIHARRGKYDTKVWLTKYARVD